ncbi:hypothetical protein [Armatimonas rosea]|uniref:Uncharacterized protein n=1 Tax=Armatimonas rosea TaxID=685828 RepID=A0A7W9W9X9_ARMRO|nr:hypothetical protein [Armatimonas rosea]MBB6053700.1 hypothetical protein [Armatimonas rosea]
MPDSNESDFGEEDDREPSPPPDRITALTLERFGVERSYQATFAIQFEEYDAVVSYSGQGIGLEGKRRGKVKFAPLWNLILLLAEQSHTLADHYRPDATFSYSFGTLFNAKLFIHRGEYTQRIYCQDGEAPPLVQVALQLLDLLLDQAVWEGEPFTIHRFPPNLVRDL